MSEWNNQPFVVEVKAGETKAFCVCGQSKTAPFCDGAHKGGDKKPHVEKFTEDKKLWICGCLKTNRSPYCDGTHKELS